jgi:uncharacterized protein (DUF433 family)
MSHANTEPHIITDPAILGGKPVIAGTRIGVDLILEKLSDGESIEDILRDYPHLTRAQVLAALAYALRLVRQVAP